MKLINIFNRIGYDHIDMKVMDVVFDIASEGYETASINSFRNILNEYLDAIETGHEQEWFHHYGLH
jgi:hypothetical protein